MAECKSTCLLLLLLLLLPLPSACRTPDCSAPQHPSLSCYNDYNRILTCEWNSSAQLDTTTCQVLAFRSNGRKYSASCILKPADISRPTLRRCSMTFDKECIFMEFHVLSVSLNCTSVAMSYTPVCHIRLSQPPKPKINTTTVSWSPEGKPNPRFNGYISEMQWREEQSDQPWINAPIKGAKWSFQSHLDKSKLIRGKRYEVRVRLKPSNRKDEATWSPWSQVVVRNPVPTPGFTESFLGMVVAGTVTFALVLAIVLLKTDKSTWAEMVKKIQGPMIPNPEKPFQTWLLNSPYFSQESFNSFLKPVEILPVEVVHSVDPVEPFRPEGAPLMLECARGNGEGETSKSSFSNPIYSELCPSTTPPPVTTLTPGNLEPCAADTPYGPAGAHSQEDTGRSQEIQQLLSKGQNDGGDLQVVSNYEKVTQVGRAQLQSVDSGVHSSEELSQESLEPDSFGEGAEPDRSLVHLHGLFDKFSSGGIVSRGCIQVVSDYERVEAGNLCSPELPSLDSGLSSAGEEQVSQEESHFPFTSPSPLSTLLLSSPLPLSFPGHRSLEPCTEGYMSKTS